MVAATVPGNRTWCGCGSPNHPSDRIGIGVHILQPGAARSPSPLD